jgi:hypothetical protein
MDLTYTHEELDAFLKNYYLKEMDTNGGGMRINDMFSFYLLLDKLKPEVVVESGVWNGQSTKLIRRVLGDTCKILCLDPRAVEVNGFTDTNTNTIYYTGNNFIDFSSLSLEKYNLENVLCFFDDHQNYAQRLLQCIEKGITHVFFNDNYPVDAGSHYSVQHLIDNDTRDKFTLGNQYSYAINTLPQIDLSKRDELINKINIYNVFPNIFPGTVDLFEGKFNVSGFFNENDIENINKYSDFYKDRNEYCWNTYLTLSRD